MSYPYDDRISFDVAARPDPGGTFIYVEPLVIEPTTVVALVAILLACGAFLEASHR